MSRSSSLMQTVLAVLAAAAVAQHQQWPGINESAFIWPAQWSAVQEIHLTSGPFAGAVQRGRIVYDFVNQRTREDQALVAGPSVKTNYTSDNMTEWFHGPIWYYMDWTTGVCMSNDFGIGPAPARPL